MKYTSKPFLDLFREMIKGLKVDEPDPLRYLDAAEKFKANNLEYCKQGMHQMLQLGMNGESQCTYCGHVEHKCNLMCNLYRKKCENHKRLNPKLPIE